jgi:hypothetical protein
MYHSPANVRLDLPPSLGLQVSAVRSRRSSDKTLFVRTHVAIYFVSLLMCNLIQSVGGLLNIRWVIVNRVYSGAVCTTQGVLKQFGNVRKGFSFIMKVGYSHFSSPQSGTGVFCFIIATHTFSVLFLRRQWSDRTTYIVLVISWALLFLEMCNESFLLAKPKEIGPYYGVAGFWCWITAAYPIERYATSYLIMFTSSAFSFILYLLVFFRLRGNMSGDKFHFHRRPSVRVGRTTNGTYIMTDDQRIASHLTRVAKHMLWYPIVYTVLILPNAASRFSAFSGKSIPFPVTMCAAVLFLLHGFFNTVLFCTTRNILPGSWRQRFGFGSTFDSRRSDFNRSSRTNATWRFTGLSTRMGSVSTGATPVVLSVGVDKDVEIKYDDAQPGSSYLKYSNSPLPAMPSSPALPTPLLRAHGGGAQWAGAHRHNVQRLSFPAPQDPRTTIRMGIDGGDNDSPTVTVAHPATKTRTIEQEVPPRSLGRASDQHESGFYGPAPGLETPTPVHMYTTHPPTGKN